MRRLLAFAFVLTMANTVTQAQVVVHPDRTVTFSFKCPGAQKVEVDIEGLVAVPMAKDSGGNWTATTEPLTPNYYGYNYLADGVSYTDPNHWLNKPNYIWQSSMFLVPGTPPEPWELQDVPHGRLDHHFFKSAIIGDQRDYFVYTPPGYSPSSREQYPVLYLLHGYSDMASGWSAVGMANVILDNLIAQGQAKPMIIVMPLGYGSANFGQTKTTGRGLGTQLYEHFRDSLFNEIIPDVQRDYRTYDDAGHRAIAGLSMGGAETLFIGVNNIARFSYIGAFSTGGLESDFPAVFPNLSSDKVNSRVKVLTVACGTSDSLIAYNRKLVEWLKEQGVSVTAVETPGKHEWPVWRRDLIAFAKAIFK